MYINCHNRHAVALRVHPDIFAHDSDDLIAHFLSDQSTMTPLHYPDELTP